MSTRDPLMNTRQAYEVTPERKIRKKIALQQGGKADHCRVKADLYHFGVVIRVVLITPLGNGAVGGRHAIARCPAGDPPPAGPRPSRWP